MTVQTDFLERCKALNLHDGKLSDWLDEIESLRQQLSAALAVCKQKDDALEKIRGHIGLYNLFSCVGSDSYDPECADLNVGKCGEIATKALAIRPDDSALKALVEGWVPVPLVPTEEMLIAGRETPCTASDEDWRDDYVDVYKSMIAAAPKGLK